jgi:5-methyltetrahydrofolate--homocysteine methyltransferase
VHTILSSATKTVRIGDDQPFAIIGERINPTGRKIFQLQLRNGDLSRIEIDVKEQVAGGAMLLDVNMGAPLADETALMTAAVTLIQQLTDLPLVIDSSIIEVLDAGLAAYQGKALQLGDGRRRTARRDPPAGQEVRCRGDRPAERRGGDP